MFSMNETKKKHENDNNDGKKSTRICSIRIDFCAVARVHIWCLFDVFVSISCIEE